MADSSETILRLKQVQEITGLGRSTIYKLIKLGLFPKQLKLGTRAVGWPSRQIFRWVADRIAAA